MTFPERILLPETEVAPQILFGFYYPETILTNEEIESWSVKTSSGKLLTAEAIFKKTGVERRFIAAEDETVYSMGIKAAKPIVEKFGGFFDFIIFTTTYPTGEHLSARLSKSLGRLLPNTLDVHAACSGFVYALSYIKERKDWFASKRVLIVSSEKLSPTLPNLKNGEEDHSLSQTIFSDGAVALSFIYGKNLKVLAVKNYAFPFLEEAEALKMPIDYDLILKSSNFSNVKYFWSLPSISGRVEMKGKTVYKATVGKVPELITDTILAAGLEFSDISLVIPHQASKHMLDGIAGRLPPNLTGKMVYDLADGNFSSASIPKALMKVQNEGRLKFGDKIVLASVGAGLFASVAVVEIG